VSASSFAANGLWLASSLPGYIAWERAARNPRSAQRAVLARILARTAESDFGRRHGFGSIRTPEEFRARVPLCSYPDVEPDVSRIAAGESRVLTGEPVRRFGVSSGSTGASKLIPYTESLVSEFRAGIDPWLFRLMANRPRLLVGSSYWSVTPVGERSRRSPGGIPIGFDDERSYLGTIGRWAYGQTMACPPELALVGDSDVFRYTTLRFLLQDERLALVSVWSPTFLTLILESLDRWVERLVRDIHDGTISESLGLDEISTLAVTRSLRRDPRRAKDLERDLASGSDRFRLVWPKLQLVSCWAHGSSAEPARRLMSLLPGVEVQPKGLVATEAFVSFPVSGEASALSLNSHYLEFEEAGSSGEALGAHELSAGGKYSVVVTTGGGLYRYRLNDTVEILGFEKRCPLVRFAGRADKVVDLCGEKLNEAFVERAVGLALASSGLRPTFWMVAPDTECHPPRYTLYLQFAGEQPEAHTVRLLSDCVEEALAEAYHYGYCRRLGQLGPVRAFIVSPGRDASHVYLEACVAAGQRLGEIKPASLHPLGHWSRWFIGSLVP
jgi:hypothetical protein